MLRELRGIDKGLYEAYLEQLSPLFRQDMKEESLFWTEYTGWINDLTGIFYSNYLSFNNQEEGLQRYNRMIRLVLAWELRARKCQN